MGVAASMKESLVYEARPGPWEDVAFHLPPLSLRGQSKKLLTEFLCLVGIAIVKPIMALRPIDKDAVPRKVLVIRRGGLGDVLMATPLLRSLREHFPSAEICALVSRQAAPGLRSSPWVDQILEVPNSRKEWLPLVRRLGKERFDTAFILHRFFAPSLLAWMAGIPRRLGFTWKDHGFALTDSISFSATRSQTRQIGQLITLLGKPAGEPIMEFPTRDCDVRSARELLASWGFDASRPLIGIHPGGGETPLASDPARRWHPQRFARLAEMLILHDCHQVVVLQGPGDEPFAEEMLRSMSAEPLGRAAGLPLPVFAALLGQCDLVVVNDTGVMHLAASQRVPVVALLGPTHPAYAPPCTAKDKVVWAGLSCSPCYHPEEYVYGQRRNGKKFFECWRSSNDCMNAISPEAVRDIVLTQVRR